jgi:hypothetical protein
VVPKGQRLRPGATALGQNTQSLAVKGQMTLRVPETKVVKGNSGLKQTGFYVLMATCVLLLVLASCSSLNESAQNVKYSTKSEAPKDCKELGEVSVGSFLPHVTMESVKNEMRNKTAAMGGNFLVIDEIKSVSSSTPPMVGSNGFMMGGGSSSSGYAGSGRAYQCPQS